MEEGYASLEKWGDPNHGVGEENEDCDKEETLSLSDLPMSAPDGDDDQKKTETRPENEQDFDFGSLCASLLTEAEMCAADEVFFQGQILPLRLSVSSESGLQGILRHECQNLSSRSESMDHHSLSSRSNSTGSHNSATAATTSTTTSTTTTTCTYKPKLRNQFHSHPSPKPQISSIPRPGNTANWSRKLTVWGVFKVGVVRTPEIQLQELKLRHTNSSNSNKRLNSRSSSSSSSRKSDREIKSREKKKKKNRERFSFEGCKCSVDAIETIVVKKNNKSVHGKENKQEVVKEEIKHKKQALYHTRTFEWLKELSIAHVPQEL